MQVLLEQGNYDEIASLTSVTLKDKQSQSIVLAVKGLAKLALNDLNGATLLIDNALSVLINQHLHLLPNLICWL